MRRPTLGQKLRAIVLAIPFAGAVACGSVGSNDGGGTSSGSTSAGCMNPGGCGPCPVETQVALLPDGGIGDGGCQPACQALEPFIFFGLQSCAFTTLDGGAAVSCTGTTPCHTGRRPPGLVPATVHSETIGALFAEAARLEAASVPAFKLLARELTAHGAPAALVRAARSAARDEVRHTKATAALARRYRAKALKPTVAPLPRKRSLEAIALENAVEGCVRETYGALVALWQTRAAADPVVAAAMVPIARDETRHAELAWKVAAWASPRLSPTARRRVAKARARAFANLRAEAMLPLPAAQIALAGLPSPVTATRLLDALEATLAG
jgi:hypothetical protein